MATTTSTVEDVFISASEKLREMFCESCKKDGEDATADGFCVNCQEYLCTTVLKYHKRLLGLHVLQDKVNMPQDFCFEKCSNHQNEMIKFYCETCDAFLCSNCAENNHKDCSKVKHLPTIVKDLKNGIEFQAVARQLSDLRQKTLLSNAKTKTNYGYIEHFRNRCMTAIKKHRENLNTKLDMLEVKLDNEIERIRVKDETINKSITTKNASLNSDLDLLQSDIDNASGDKCKLFMAMKKVQKEMKLIEVELKLLMKENKVTAYIFEPESRITDIFDSVDRLGSVIHLDSKTKRRAKYVSDIIVKSSEDRTDCNITGICLLSKRFLVLVDSRNKSVKLVDTVANTIKSVLHLNARPWDVTTIGDQEVAVTIIRRQVVQFISVPGKLSLCKTIDVEGDCRGIEESDGNLIVTFINPGKVQILDTKGTVLQSFSKDSRVKNLFLSPLYLAVSADKSQIYVTDIDLSSVVSLSLKGNDVAIYKDASLQNPVGIATDRTGAVYVCERDTNEIHHMSDDMDKVEIFIDKAKKLPKPCSCTVDAEANTMFIGLDEQSVIKQFTIEF